MSATGKALKFLLVEPQHFFVNTTNHKWKAQQFFTRHDNREDNIKLSVTTIYSQLINIRIRHVIQQS